MPFSLSTRSNFADIEAVFTVTMLRKYNCEPVAATRGVARSA
jgi:hypothetical protein